MMQRTIKVQLPNYADFPSEPNPDATFYEACDQAIAAALPPGTRLVGYDAIIAKTVKHEVDVVVEESAGYVEGLCRRTNIQEVETGDSLR
jgi:hypothetical protein